MRRGLHGLENGEVICSWGVRGGSGEDGRRTATVPLVCVVRVLCSWCSAVLEYLAAFSVFSSYCCRLVTEM